MNPSEKQHILNQAILIMTIEKNEANKKFIESESGTMPLCETVAIEKECNEAIRIMEKIKKAI